MNRNIDKSNMRDVIVNFPKQFEEALEFSKNISVKGSFENVIISGMGGSALAADILINWIKPRVPVYIRRDYGLPSQTNKKSLVVSISYSGNTEETISALNEAVDRKIKTAAIASNGKIEAICRKHNIPMIRIPYGIQPRSAIGYMFTSLATLLANSKIIANKSEEISELAKELKKLDQAQKAKELAEKLVNKIPLIYSSSRFKSLARNWKIKFNENSKIPAFYNYFPELNHNEMVGFSQIKKTADFHIIILKDKDDHPQNIKRMKLFAELMESKGMGVDFVSIKEGSLLFKIFSTLVLGDWVSYELALKYGIDPTPVKIVEEFKKKLNEQAGMAEQKTR